METPISINPETKQKLDSAVAHGKAVLDATSTATKEVGEVVKKHAKATFDTSKEHLTAAVKNVGDAATCTMQDVSAQAQTAYGEAVARAKNFQTQSEDYIRANPLQAVGIALAAGLLFGLISRR